MTTAIIVLIKRTIKSSIFLCKIYYIQRKQYTPLPQWYQRFCVIKPFLPVLSIAEGKVGIFSPDILRGRMSFRAGTESITVFCPPSSVFVVLRLEFYVRIKLCYTLNAADTRLPHVLRGFSESGSFTNITVLHRLAATRRLIWQSP
jgi:hypothetical protein